MGEMMETKCRKSLKNHKTERKSRIVSVSTKQIRLNGIAMLIIFSLVLFVILPGESNAARIKDLAYINGVRSNQLVG